MLASFDDIIISTGRRHGNLIPDFL